MTLFEMSASGAVLIGVILLLRRGLLYRLPKWTFLLLWGVALCRLLVPFRLPSPVSVYTGAAQVIRAVREEPPSAPVLDGAVPRPDSYPGVFWEDVWTVGQPAAPQEPVQRPVPPLTVAAGAGAALCALFFLGAYGRGLRRFRGAVPAREEFITRWQKEHPTLFPVQIKISSAVNTPLAYGLVRPAILLPEQTDWADEEQLTYVLTHEYVHIRWGDMLWKLLLTGALCLHWYNPLVWAMYFCANRDLELACDEAVVRVLGLDRRKGYAFALLSAEQGRISPLCTTFASNRCMEERIRAIMKLKQKSIAALLAAAVLVAGVTAVFATSRTPTQEEITKLPLAVQSGPSPVASQPEDGKAGDISAVPWEYDIVQPEEGEAAGTVTPAKAPEDRVHPVTGEADDSSQTPAEKIRLLPHLNSPLRTTRRLGPITTIFRRITSTMTPAPPTRPTSGDFRRMA